MNKIFLLFTFSVLFILGACSPDKSETAASATSELEPGKFAVVNYWAEWCKPCREEIPELNELATQYAGDVNVYAINFDGVSGEALTTLSADFGIEYPARDKAFAQKIGIPNPVALPTTVIFDREGNQLVSLIGPQTAASLAAYFN